MQSSEIAIRYLHFVSIFVVIAIVFAVHLLLERKMTTLQLRRISRLDFIYCVAAIVALVTGILQWITVGKPSAFYTKNWIFHFKIVTFIVVGLISIYPTVFFAKAGNGKVGESVSVPGGIFWAVRIELLLLFTLPLLAVMVARGIGLMVD